MTNESEKTPMRQPPKISLGFSADEVDQAGPKKEAAPNSEASTPPNKSQVAPSASSEKKSPQRAPASKPVIPKSEQPRSAADLKSKTIPIGSLQGQSLDSLYKTAMHMTQRVILEEKVKAETSRLSALETQAISSDDNVKKSAQKVSEEEVLEPPATKKPIPLNLTSEAKKEEAPAEQAEEKPSAPPKEPPVQKPDVTAAKEPEEKPEPKAVETPVEEAKAPPAAKKPIPLNLTPEVKKEEAPAEQAEEKPSEPPKKPISLNLGAGMKGEEAAATQPDDRADQPPAQKVATPPPAKKPAVLSIKKSAEAAKEPPVQQPSDTPDEQAKEPPVQKPDVSTPDEPEESDVLEKAEQAEKSKKSSARVDLDEFLSKQDREELEKDRTLHIDEDGSARKPVAVESKKEDRPVAAKSDVPTNDQTMAIQFDEKKDEEEAPEEKKSETARIELPREVASGTPSSQRKTIRIKRPEAGGAPAGGRKLSVARSTPAKEESGGGEETSTGSEKFVLDQAEDTAHPVFSVLALIAVLVSLVVVYALAASLMPELPFPGRLV